MNKRYSTEAERLAARQASRQRWVKNNPTYHKEYAALHREGTREYYTEYRRKNRERIRAMPSSSTEARRAWGFKKKYGITQDQYDSMAVAQNGVCLLCKTPPTDRYKRLHIDHCHRTGKVRGLLCHRCNTALGLLKEDLEVIGRALQYLSET